MKAHFCCAKWRCKYDRKHDWCCQKKWLHCKTWFQSHLFFYPSTWFFISFSGELRTKRIFLWTLNQLVAHLGPQFFPRREIETTFLILATTRGLSRVIATNWLFRHLRGICCLEESSSSAQRSKSWWVLAAGFKTFISTFHICCNTIQWHDTLLVEQRARLDKLRDELRREGWMDGLYNSIELHLVGDQIMVAASQHADCIDLL